MPRRTGSALCLAAGIALGPDADASAKSETRTSGGAEAGYVPDDFVAEGAGVECLALEAAW